MTSGFKDRTGTYLTDREWSGVWVSDRPLDCNEGLPLETDALLEIDIDVPESSLAGFEWVEEGKPYREWLIPAELLNKNAKVRLIDEDVGFAE